MEGPQIYKLYSQMKFWPKTHVELNDLALKFVDPLGAIWVGLTPSLGTEIGIGISGESNRQGILTLLLDQLKTPRVGEFQVKELHLGAIGLTAIGRADYLVVSRFAGLHHRSTQPVGEAILVAGYAQPLSPAQESEFFALSYHLFQLILVETLTEQVQLRSQFLSIASHELKTPLTSIYGILQLQERMLRPQKDKSDQTDANLLVDQDRYLNLLKMVIRQVERMNELIDGLLDVSRIQNDRFMVDPTETDVVILLQDCVQARLNFLAKEAGVKIHIDTPDVLRAWVDPVRMEEVIHNLVMNAIRTSPEGGVIWIRLRQDEGSFRLTVRDQGMSIPIQDREKIFEPFERVQQPVRMGGLGLGLFISRQIALLHGGNVSLVESVPGKGNVFEAHFPLQNAHLVVD